MRQNRTKGFEIEMRYATFTNAVLEIYSNGELLETIDLPSTGKNYIWNTAVFSLPLIKGKQTQRFKLTDGACTINWWRYL